MKCTTGIGAKTAPCRLRTLCMWYYRTYVRTYVQHLVHVVLSLAPDKCFKSNNLVCECATEKGKLDHKDKVIKLAIRVFRVLDRSYVAFIETYRKVFIITMSPELSATT